MDTLTVKVYSFDELSDETKDEITDGIPYDELNKGEK